MSVFDCPPVWTGPEYSFPGNMTESVYGLSGDVQSHGWLPNATAASLRCDTQKSTGASHGAAWDTVGETKHRLSGNGLCLSKKCLVFSQMNSLF